MTETKGDEPILNNYVYCVKQTSTLHTPAALTEASTYLGQAPSVAVRTQRFPLQDELIAQTGDYTRGSTGSGQSRAQSVPFLPNWVNLLT